MRNDVTRVALVATEPEIIQNEVFWGLQEGGKIMVVLEWPFAAPAYTLAPWLWELKATRGELSTVFDCGSDSDSDSDSDSACGSDSDSDSDSNSDFTSESDSDSDAESNFHSNFLSDFFK